MERDYGCQPATRAKLNWLGERARLPVGNAIAIVPDECAWALQVWHRRGAERRHVAGRLATGSSSLLRNRLIGFFTCFGFRRCLAFGLQRFGHASAWHRFSPCCSSFHAKDRTSKSAVPAQCMARHRRKVGVFPPTSGRTCIAAFVVDRVAINSTCMRRPHAKACWRLPLICANERAARSPGWRPNEFVCPPPNRHYGTPSGIRSQPGQGHWRYASGARPAIRSRAMKCLRSAWLPAARSARVGDGISIAQLRRQI